MSRVAAVQMVSGDDVAANLETAARLLSRAQQAGAVLAVLPENFALMSAREAEKLEVAEAEGQGPIQEFLATTARRLRLWIVAGTVPLQADGRRVYAASLVYGDDGRQRARYDKMHLFDVELPGTEGAAERYRESATIAPGDDRTVVVETPAGRLGMTVCYDLRFPELYRRLGAAGAELLAVPSAFTARTGEAHWLSLLRARAIENQCYVVAPNQGGAHPGGRRTWGHSVIIDPWGQCLAECENGEGVIVAALPRDRLLNLRQSFPVLQHRRIP